MFLRPVSLIEIRQRGSSTIMAGPQVHSALQLCFSYLFIRLESEPQIILASPPIWVLWILPVRVCFSNLCRTNEQAINLSNKSFLMFVMLMREVSGVDQEVVGTSGCNAGGLWLANWLLLGCRKLRGTQTEDLSGLTQCNCSCIYSQQVGSEMK